LSVAIAPVLHVPDEPLARAEEWHGAVVQQGRPLETVLGAEDGLAQWLWSRWRSLTSVGLSEDEFGHIVLGYRREIWLWLAGERTWTQCCSGLIGRINRRLVSSDHPGG
jgi:hypothetical protein